MPTPNATKRQIDGIVRYAVERSLADDQNFAYLNGDARNSAEVTFPGAELIGIAMRNVPYEEIYEKLAAERVFNIKMLDGALIQMMYQFSQGTLFSHRLAFFPSPFLEQFQNNPDIYLDDEVYADVVAKNIVHVPIRFDYDARDSRHEEVAHPKSHLTLGQYENCRIPVSAPLTPIQFFDFLLRNFYHTAHDKYADGLPAFSGKFDPSITSAEQRVVHVVIPAQVAWSSS